MVTQLEEPIVYLNQQGVSARKGIIKISEKLVLEVPHLIVEIFAQIGFLPYYIDQTTHHGIYQYYGYSDNFAEVLVGRNIPIYEPLCTYYHNGGNWVLTKVEIK